MVSLYVVSDSVELVTCAKRFFKGADLEGIFDIANCIEHSVQIGSVVLIEEVQNANKLSSSPPTVLRST